MHMKFDSIELLNLLYYANKNLFDRRIFKNYHRIFGDIIVGGGSNYLDQDIVAEISIVKAESWA